MQSQSTQPELFGSVPVVSLRIVRESSQPYASGPQLNAPELVASLLRPHVEGLDREALFVVTLDAKYRPNGINCVSLGTLNSSLAEPREVFKLAVLQNAASIVIAHNHPSGDTTPSPADLRVTHQLVACGVLLGIKVLDHLILADGGRFLSLADEGHVSRASAIARDSISNFADNL